MNNGALDIPLMRPERKPGSQPVQWLPRIHVCQASQGEPGLIEGYIRISCNDLANSHCLRVADPQYAQICLKDHLSAIGQGLGRLRDIDRERKHSSRVPAVFWTMIVRLRGF